MTLAKFVEYIKVHLTWKNKPDQSTPILGEHMMTIESGIKANNEAIQELAAAVVSQITNDPNKIASMAALYSVNKKADDLISDLTQYYELMRGGTMASADWVKIGKLERITANTANRPFDYGVSFALLTDVNAMYVLQIAIPLTTSGVTNIFFRCISTATYGISTGNTQVSGEWRKIVFTK